MATFSEVASFDFPMPSVTTRSAQPADVTIISGLTPVYTPYIDSRRWSDKPSGTANSPLCRSISACCARGRVGGLGTITISGSTTAAGYKSAATVGYNLVQFIASPIHGSVIPTLNVYNPDLVRSAVEPHVFLLLEADSSLSPAALRGTLVNAKGDRVFSYGLTAAELNAG